MDEKTTSTKISSFADHARKPDQASSPLVASITVVPDYGPFTGQPKAEEKYWQMRLGDDIDRARRGRDPQCVWVDELYDALHAVAKAVREAAAKVEED